MKVLPVLALISRFRVFGFTYGRWTHRVGDICHHIGPFHADVSVRACTSCRSLLITNKQKGCGRLVVGYCC